MTANDIWALFRIKLSDDALCDEDFTDETRHLLKSFLSGPDSSSRRAKFSSSPAQYFDTEAKAIVLLTCPDDHYRFDFIKNSEGYSLAFIECITLPISDIKAFPYDKFAPLCDKETHIRCEKEISKIIWMYLKFKELLGRDEAIKVFMDGSGESIAARSWVPFYNDRLSYIAYAAWTENRITGEDIAITAFSDDKSVLLFRNHIWRRMYAVTGHLKTLIGYEEFIWIFEEIWRDRARASGWNVEFSYMGDDTSMTFTTL